MLTIVRRTSGLRADALILAASEACMRVVFRGSSETTELSRIGPYWVTDRGELVELDMLIPVQDAGTYLADQRSKPLSAVA